MAKVAFHRTPAKKTNGWVKAGRDDPVCYAKEFAVTREETLSVNYAATYDVIGAEGRTIGFILVITNFLSSISFISIAVVFTAWISASRKIVKHFTKLVYN